VTLNTSLRLVTSACLLTAAAMPAAALAHAEGTDVVLGVVAEGAEILIPDVRLEADGAKFSERGVLLAWPISGMGKGADLGPRRRRLSIGMFVEPQWSQMDGFGFALGPRLGWQLGWLQGRVDGVVGLRGKEPGVGVGVSVGGGPLAALSDKVEAETILAFVTFRRTWRGGELRDEVGIDFDLDFLLRDRAKEELKQERERWLRYQPPRDRQIQLERHELVRDRARGLWITTGTRPQVEDGPTAIALLFERPYGASGGPSLVTYYALTGSAPDNVHLRQTGLDHLSPAKLLGGPDVDLVFNRMRWPYQYAYLDRLTTLLLAEGEFRDAAPRGGYWLDRERVLLGMGHSAELFHPASGRREILLEAPGSTIEVIGGYGIDGSWVVAWLQESPSGVELWSGELQLDGIRPAIANRRRHTSATPVSGRRLALVDACGVGMLVFGPSHADNQLLTAALHPTRGLSEPSELLPASANQEQYVSFVRTADALIIVRHWDLVAKQEPESIIARAVPGKTGYYLAEVEAAEVACTSRFCAVLQRSKEESYLLPLHLEEPPSSRQCN
jgi:hypothetical protein